MSVVIEQLALGGGGGGVPVTQYTMVMTNGQLDPTLFAIIGGFQSPYSTDFLAPTITGGQFQCLRNGGVGNNVGGAPCAIIPRPLLNNSVKGRAQFAQGRIISITTIGSSLGPAVYLAGNWINRDGTANADGGNGYYIGPSTAAFPGNMFVRRAALTNTVLSTIAGWALNDIARLEVRPNTPAAGQFQLQTFRNGTLVDTTVDNAGTPPEPQPSVGWPGWYVAGIPIPTNSQQTWDTISWGVL